MSRRMHSTGDRGQTRVLGAAYLVGGLLGAWLLLPRESWFEDSHYVLVIGNLSIPLGVIYLIPWLFAIALVIAGAQMLVAPGRARGLPSSGSTSGARATSRTRKDLSLLGTRARARAAKKGLTWPQEASEQWRVLMRDESETRTTAKRALAEMGAPVVPLMVFVLMEPAVPLEGFMGPIDTHSKAVRILDLMGDRKNAALADLATSGHPQVREFLRSAAPASVVGWAHR